MRLVQIALASAIICAAAPSFAQQKQGQGSANTGTSNKAEACRAEARKATYAIMRGSGTSSIVEAEARGARMRAYFLKCMGRS
jgi:hypothetical protein